ncbi:MAG: SEC-C domain-containing protein, partial [Pseudomonadota bacterium]|nr:SEC-C domain-containing protein [Pseudomonadota bacterium]
MPRSSKISRNDLCPCGTGRKYKRCCEPRLDWNEVFRSKCDWRQYLSIRGRNLYFAKSIANILQLEAPGSVLSPARFKAAFTAAAVQQIHEKVMEAWPPTLDIHAALSGASADVSGLYIGDYGLEYITRGIVRHSIYANKILVVDPFVYPTSVRDEYNPIINPEQYRAQTLKNVNFWFSFLPWIEAGLVEIIRTPSDFDRRLNWESMERQYQKFETNEVLKKAAEESVQELKKRHMNNASFHHLILSAPDSHLLSLFEDLKLEKDGFSAEDFLDYVHRQREADINFLEPLGPDSKSGQLHMM